MLLNCPYLTDNRTLFNRLLFRAKWTTSICFSSVSVSSVMSCLHTVWLLVCSLKQGAKRLFCILILLKQRTSLGSGIFPYLGYYGRFRMNHSQRKGGWNPRFLVSPWSVYFFFISLIWFPLQLLTFLNITLPHALDGWCYFCLLLPMALFLEVKAVRVFPWGPQLLFHVQVTPRA